MTDEFLKDVDMSHGFLSMVGCGDAKCITLRVHYNHRTLTQRALDAENKELSQQTRDAANRSVGRAEGFLQPDLDTWHFFSDKQKYAPPEFAPPDDEPPDDDGNDPLEADDPPEVINE